MNEKAPWQILVEELDTSGAWGCFNGAWQGDPPICGGGGILHLNDNRAYKFKPGLWRGNAILQSCWL